MDSVLKHRYIAALVFAGALFTLGTAVVLSRSGVNPENSYNTINVNGVIQQTNSSVPIPQAPEPVRPTAIDLPYTKITTQTKTDAPQNSTPDYFDWNSFVSSLSHAPTQQTKISDSGLSDAYAFIPTGLMTPPDSQPQTTMTASQKALYAWGNDAGSVVQAYENFHTDQAATLTNFMQDRENPAKITTMKQLGADLQAVGNSLETIGEIPAQIKTSATALSDAYREIGRNLAAIPDARGDEATVKEIQTYNSSAEAFVQKFVNVVLTFQANAVAFSQNEPGSVFMFPAN